MSDFETARFGIETWMKGDRGNLHPYATDRPKLVNTRIYRDGSLGPRPAWAAEMTTTGLGFGTDALIWPARYFVGYGYSTGSPGVAISDGSFLKIYQWQGAGIPAATPLAEYAGPCPTSQHTLVRIDEAFWLSNDKLIEFRGPLAVPQAIQVTDINPALDAAFAGASSFYCVGSTVHDSRAFYWGAIFSGTTYTNKGRLWYSDPYAYGTFSSATQYLEVDGTIAGAVPVGSHLYIWTEDAKWYMLQGRGNPADATLTPLGGGRFPYKNRTPALVDDRAYFISSDLTTMVVLTSDGEMDEMSMQHYGARTAAPVFEWGNYTALLRPAGDSELNTLLQPIGGGLARAMHDGVWMSEEWTEMTMSGDDDEQVGVIYQDNGEMLSVRDPALATNYRIYYRRSSIDEPETFGNVECEVVLPRIISPNESLRVRSVTVECRTWSPTSPLPALAVSVSDGNNETTVFSPGPLSGSVTAVGVGEESHEFVFTSSPVAFSAFADVTLTFAGMVIESVYVEFERSKEPLA